MQSKNSLQKELHFEKKNKDMQLVMRYILFVKYIMSHVAGKLHNAGKKKNHPGITSCANFRIKFTGSVHTVIKSECVPNKTLRMLVSTLHCK